MSDALDDSKTTSTDRLIRGARGVARGRCGGDTQTP